MRNNKETDKLVAKKLKSPLTKEEKLIKTLNDTINLIKDDVENTLGKFKDDYEIITNTVRLNNYFESCKNNGIIAIDTETTGLDPIIDKIVGLCLYTPNKKGAYIPINHIDYKTGNRIENQLNENQVGEICNNWLTKDNSIKVIMFNSSFDIRVMRNQLNCYLTCYWDSYLAARLLNENEESNTLKKLHQKYVLNDAEDEFGFSKLFKGLSFNIIPINIAYLYAAHDAVITYELYKFQSQYLRLDNPKDDMKKIAKVFFNIEMPCVNVVCDMEDTGVSLDLVYSKKLSDKYNLLLNERLNNFYTILEQYQDKIDLYNKSVEKSKLSDPINIASPTQLAILLYDIIGIQPVDKKSPRGTGSEILQKINIPLTTAILEYRQVAILIKTFIDKLPTVINPNDGRIHCRFNQYGAVTGRFSSSDPNLQNIPSHNKDIRKMFVASPGYVLMGSDYSQQEPKALAALCRQAGDSQMYDTFMAGKDLYSEIASKAFNVSYEDCLEFNPDGSQNKAGIERRNNAKRILLGVLYGRGTASIAEQLGCTIEKAIKIKRSVFKGFPAIEKFETDSLNMAYELGYVTTICGRKRRLYDLWLDEFEFKWNNTDLNDNNIAIPESKINYYRNKLSKVKFTQKRKIFEEANKEGIWIVDNGAKIADAERQCVNARIQGSAADLTKYAMIKLNTNPRLKELGFRLLIQVHDEVIAECPEKSARECKDLLSKIMSQAAEEILEMPMKCDVVVTKEWYGVPYNL